MLVHVYMILFIRYRYKGVVCYMYIRIYLLDIEIKRLCVCYMYICIYLLDIDIKGLCVTCIYVSIY